MTFKEWKSWLAELPWPLRWFPVLVLLRPVVDNFYYLKEVSPFLSPLYIVGLLTPVLAIIAIIRYKQAEFSALDKAFIYWTLAVLFSCLFIFFYGSYSLLSIEFILKLSLPVYLYFFLRRLIQSRRDLDGILQSFLYSGIFVALILLFEVFVNPIRIEESRGLGRIQGNFGDVVSYGIYIVFSFLIATYFYFSRLHLDQTKKSIRLVAIVALIGILGLFNIHHTATYVIFSILLLLFLLFNFKTAKRSLSMLIILIVGAGLIFFSNSIEEKLTPLVATDLQVFEGTQDADRLMHGRVGRWIDMWEIFTAQTMPVQFFGYPLKMEYAYHYIGIGSHNDLVRMLFATGYLGLILYLVLLIRVYIRSSLFGLAQQFLILGCLITLLLYSISITPTFYAPFMYIVMSIFAFAAIPPKILLENE